MPTYDLDKYYSTPAENTPEYKYPTEEDVPQASIEKYISERNKLKSPDTGFINPESDSELRDAMLRGDFDTAVESDTPQFDLSSYYKKVPEEKDTPSFMDDLSGALSSGYRNMKAGIAGTGVIAGAVDKETAAASFVDAMKNQPETPEYYRKFLEKAELEGKDVTEAEGIWDTTVESLDLVGEVLLEAVTNPKGLAYIITESAAQSLPAIGLGGAGAVAGTVTAPGIGTLVGLAAGTGLGTFAVEAGGHLKGLVVDKLRKQGRSIKDVGEQDIIETFEDPAFMDWAESEAIKRGLSVAAVEGLFAAFGGKLLSGAAGKSVFSKSTRAAADVGVESVGEATGELAGQLATEGPVDPGAIAMEAVAGLGQSAATTATGAALRAPMRRKPKDTLDSLFGEGTDDIEGDALTNLNAGSVLPELEPLIEPTDLESQAAGALELIDSHDDLADSYAGYKKSGMLDMSIPGALYEDALAVPHPQRTDGQKALVAMGREAESEALSPIEKMRGQSEDAVDISIPEATPEVKAAIPDALKATSDIIQEIADATPAEQEVVIEAQPIESDTRAESPVIDTPSRSVADIKAEIETVAANKPKGFEAAKLNQKHLLTLIDERDAAIKLEIDAAANQAQTSELNSLPEPSEEQAKAGDYKKGLLDLNGFGIAIENPKGSTRSGVDAQGKTWSTKMKDHYGEIQNTEGADGDNVDVFIGDNPESKKVFIVDQIDPATGKFDEHKVIMGASTLNKAKMTYNRNYAKGWKGAAEITEMSVDEFKQWVNFGDTRKPIKYVEEKIDGKPTDRTDSESITDGAIEPASKPTADSIEPRDSKSKVDSRKGEKPRDESISRVPIGTKRAVSDAIQRDKTTRAPKLSTAEGGKPTTIVTPSVGIESKKDGRPTLEPMPKQVFTGLGRVKPKPIGKTLYRETNAMGVSTLLSNTLSNNAERGSIDRTFVADTKDLALGQKDNKGVHIEFDGNLVSGSIVEKPGMAISEGKEYHTDYIGRDAITKITVPKGAKVVGPARVFAKRQFNITKMSDGSTVYTRKDLPTPAPITETIAPKTETIAPKTETIAPKTETPTEDTTVAKRGEMRGGEPEGITAKELLPEPSTLSEAVSSGSPSKTLDFIKARTESPALREIIERIHDSIPMSLSIVSLKVGDKDPSKRGMSGANGLYQRSTNTIFIKDESFVENGMDETTLVHELLHAVTNDLLRTGNLSANKGSDLSNAVVELHRIRNEAVKELHRRLKAGWRPKTNLHEIALENVDELISWGLTTPEFQDMLKSMPSKNQSMWNDFVQTISRMLGIAEDSQNALSDLMTAVDHLISADYRVDQSMRDQLRVVIKSSSFKVEAPQLSQIKQVEDLELRASVLRMDRDTQTVITAGRDLKHVEAELELLQKEIQDKREGDPYFESGTDNIDAQGDALMGKPKSRMTLRERLKSFVGDKLNIFKDMSYYLGRMTSSAYIIEAQERKTHGSRLSAEDSMTAAVHKSWNSKVAASMAIHEHGVKMENGTIVPDETKPGLSQILEVVAKHGERYLRRFEQYLLLQRSQQLMEQGRENFVTQENIDLMNGWLDRNPNTKALFEAQQKEFRNWNKSMLDIAIAAGWINEQDAYGGWVAADEDGNELMNIGSTYFESKEDALEVGTTASEVEGWYSDMYVPFYRMGEETGATRTVGGTKRTAGDVSKATKKLKGGEGQIPILENIVRNAEFLVNGSMRTVAMQKIEEEFQDTVMDELDGVDVPGLVNASEMREAYKNMQEEAAIDGEPIPAMSAVDAKRWAQLKSFARPADASTVVVYRNGRPKYYKVQDPRLLTALKSVGAYRAKNWVKAIGMPTRLLQKSITIMPAFLARSFVRELSNAFIVNRRGGINPLKTIGKGLKNFSKIAVGDNAWMNEMMTGGYVSYNNYYNTTPDSMRTKLERAGVKRSTFKNILLSPWDGLKSAGRLYMQIAVASEHASRRTVYDDYMKAGASKDEAMYQALDVMNFSRRSDFAAMEIALSVIPFLNPRIQGLDRLYRGAKEDWKPFALKAGLMTASATALSLFNWEENEDEMNKLKDEDKAMNYHIFLDLGRGTKEHWRIPKGFEVGQITGTLPEFFVEQLYADAAEPASKALRRFMTTTFGLQMPQAVAPAYAVATNEDPFRQRPIINYGQQFLLPPAQFDAWTSKLIVDISQSMPQSSPDWLRSPKKLEYLIKGYTGSAGAMVLEGIDDIYRMTGNAPDLPTKKTSELYIVRDFYRTGSVSSSKQMDLFYSMVMETGKLASTLKAAKDTSRAEYRGLRVEHAEKLRARKALNKYSREMSSMSSKMRKIMQSDTLSPDAKERQKDALTKRKNALAQRAVDRYWHIFE